MLGRLPSEYSGGLSLDSVDPHVKVANRSINCNTDQTQEVINSNKDSDPSVSDSVDVNLNSTSTSAILNQVEVRPSCIKVPLLLSPKSKKSTRGPLKTISFFFSQPSPSPTRNQINNQTINTSNTEADTTVSDVNISVPAYRSSITPIPSSRKTDTHAHTLASSRSSSRSCDASVYDHDAVLQIEEFIEIEYDVFYNLLLIVDKRGKLCMTNLWSVSGLSQIKLRAYQFDCLCKYIVPKLHTHFHEIQLQPEVLVAQWFITLFSYTVPLRILIKLWDHIFVHGWAGVSLYYCTILLLSTLIVLYYL